MLDAYIWRKTLIAREQKDEIFVISYWQNVSIFVKMQKRLRNSCLVLNCLCWTLRQAETLTNRQTDRQTDRDRDRQTDRQTNRQTDRKTKEQKDRETFRETDRQTDRRTDRHCQNLGAFGQIPYEFFVRVKWKTWFEKTALNMSIRRVIFLLAKT